MSVSVNIEYFNYLGKKIRERREELHLTQEELADEIGSSRQTIGKIESPNYQKYPNYAPPFKVLIKIAERLNCSIDYLTGHDKYITHDIKGVCEYTGLSESAVNFLHSPAGTLARDVINDLFTRPDIFGLIESYGHWKEEPILLEISDKSGKSVQIHGDGMVNTWDYKKDILEQFESNWDSRARISKVDEYLDTSNLHGELYIGQFPISEMAFKNATLDLIGKTIEEIYKKQEEPKTTAAKGKKKKKKE